MLVVKMSDVEAHPKDYHQSKRRRLEEGIGAVQAHHRHREHHVRPPGHRRVPHRDGHQESHEAPRGHEGGAQGGLRRRHGLTRGQTRDVFARRLRERDANETRLAKRPRGFVKPPSEPLRRARVPSHCRHRHEHEQPLLVRKRTPTRAIRTAPIKVDYKDYDRPLPHTPSRRIISRRCRTPWALTPRARPARIATARTPRSATPIPGSSACTRRTSTSSPRSVAFPSPPRRSLLPARRRRRRRRSLLLPPRRR